MNKRITAAVVVVVAVVLLAAVALSGLNLNLSSQAAPGKNIVQTAQDDKNLTKFNGALNTSGLTEALNGTGPYTVFAPTDAAFSAMNQTQLNNLTKDNASLIKVLKYHVVPGKILMSQLNTNLTLKTLEGGNLVIIKNQTGTYVNNASIITNGTEASNGLLYAVNKVLLPQTIVQTINNTSQLSKLAGALKMANLTDGLNGTGPFTVFAPSNDAFVAMQGEIDRLVAANDTANLTKLLAYHVLPYSLVVGNGTNSSLLKTVEGDYLVLTVNSTGVFVNNAKVTTSNLICTNGVVHIIDKVLIPPKNILQTAKDDGNFTKLLGAIDAANLTATLNGTGPFTVFAPNDAAFNKLDQAVLSKLTTSDKANLTKLLTYHVVSGMVPSFELKNGTVTTLEGEKLNVTVNGTVIKVGNATIIVKDIICTNGMIHVIDQVLVPPSMDLKAVSSSTTPSGGTTPTPSGGGTCPG